MPYLIYTVVKGFSVTLIISPMQMKIWNFRVIHWLGRGNWFERLQFQMPQKLITQEA